MMREVLTIPERDFLTIYLHEPEELYNPGSRSRLRSRSAQKTAAEAPKRKLITLQAREREEATQRHLLGSL